MADKEMTYEEIMADMDKIDNKSILQKIKEQGGILGYVDSKINPGYDEKNLAGLATGRDISPTDVARNATKAGAKAAGASLVGKLGGDLLFKGIFAKKLGRANILDALAAKNLNGPIAKKFVRDIDPIGDLNKAAEKVGKAFNKAEKIGTAGGIASGAISIGKEAGKNAITKENAPDKTNWMTESASGLKMKMLNEGRDEIDISKTKQILDNYVKYYEMYNGEPSKRMKAFFEEYKNIRNADREEYLDWLLSVPVQRNINAIENKEMLLSEAEYSDNPILGDIMNMAQASDDSDFEKKYGVSKEEARKLLDESWDKEKDDPLFDKVMSLIGKFKKNK